MDLPSAELVGSSNDEKSLPGMVLNIKKPIVYEDYFGFQHRCVLPFRTFDAVVFLLFFFLCIFNYLFIPNHHCLNLHEVHLARYLKFNK